MEGSMKSQLLNKIERSWVCGCTCPLICRFWCLPEVRHWGHLCWVFSERKMVSWAAFPACLGWMASLTQWTWVWASFRRWWRTGTSGVLQSMGLQRVRQDWATEMNCVSSWAHFMLICLCYVLRLCHFFKSCALPPSLLFRKYNQERIRHMEIC